MTERLIKEAIAAMNRAYAPYSSFKVGAALLTRGGEVYRGCNVENVSLGLTMCAERVALGGAVQAGAAELERIAIVADSAEPIVPCGACRQVLAEFRADLPIISSTLNGKVAEFSLDVLLPRARQGILQ
ncbi:MAG TPA: cytidine deaminase [Chthoniobacterales bacterium]|jgi:cytidine deaminase